MDDLLNGPCLSHCFKCPYGVVVASNLALSITFALIVTITLNIKQEELIASLTPEQREKFSSAPPMSGWKSASAASGQGSAPPALAGEPGPGLASASGPARCLSTAARLFLPASPRRKPQGTYESHAVPSARAHPRLLGAGLGIRIGQVRSDRHQG